MIGETIVRSKRSFVTIQNTRSYSLSLIRPYFLGRLKQSKSIFYHAHFQCQIKGLKDLKQLCSELNSRQYQGHAWPGKRQIVTQKNEEPNTTIITTLEINLNIAWAFNVFFRECLVCFLPLKKLMTYLKKQNKFLGYLTNNGNYEKHIFPNFIN